MGNAVTKVTEDVRKDLIDSIKLFDGNDYLVFNCIPNQEMMLKLIASLLLLHKAMGYTRGDAETNIQNMIRGTIQKYHDNTEYGDILQNYIQDRRFYSEAYIILRCPHSTQFDKCDLQDDACRDKIYDELSNVYKPKSHDLSDATFDDNDAAVDNALDLIYDIMVSNQLLFAVSDRGVKLTNDPKIVEQVRFDEQVLRGWTPPHVSHIGDINPDDDPNMLLPDMDEESVEYARRNAMHPTGRSHTSRNIRPPPAAVTETMPSTYKFTTLLSGPTVPSKPSKLVLALRKLATTNIYKSDTELTPSALTLSATQKSPLPKSSTQKSSTQKSSTQKSSTQKSKTNTMPKTTVFEETTSKAFNQWLNIYLSNCADKTGIKRLLPFIANHIQMYGGSSGVASDALEFGLTESRYNNVLEVWNNIPSMEHAKFYIPILDCMRDTYKQLETDNKLGGNQDGNQGGNQDGNQGGNQGGNPGGNQEWTSGGADEFSDVYPEEGQSPLDMYVFLTCIECVKNMLTGKISCRTYQDSSPAPSHLYPTWPTQYDTPDVNP
jgi:hypothetical protein